jgi:pimeloyl-ACP methyl ester carboxylesterase
VRLPWGFRLVAIWRLMAGMLNAILHGSPTDAPPLVIAHGLFGSARNWGAVAKRLASGRLVVAVDMRNHGDSPHEAAHTYTAMAGDLAEVIAAQGGRADLLGHSMGGKAAMLLALTEPALVRRLVVADMAPVAYGHSQIEYVLAMQAVDLAAVGRRSDADAMLAELVPEAGLRAFFLQSLATAAGAASWKLNLAALGDQMPEIMGFPEVAGRFEGPALFVSGAASDYVRTEHWPRIRELFPAATSVAIPGAGHWLHAEAPEAFVAAVEGFLAAPG